MVAMIATVASGTGRLYQGGLDPVNHGSDDPITARYTC